MGKRKREDELPHNLWRRSNEVVCYTKIYSVLQNSFKPMFTQYAVNRFVDLATREAAMKVCPSLVSIIAYLGEVKIFWASGIVIECDVVNDTFVSTILTSASLLPKEFRLDSCKNVPPKEFKVVVNLPNGNTCEGDIFAYDLHINICAIKIKSSASLPKANLSCVDDTIYTTEDKERSFRLRPHSDLMKLIPGTNFIALGRYHCQPYNLMVAPGKLSIECCNFDCQELLKANCKITKCGIGGPMINLKGEVVGINFYAEDFTPFLPSNVVCKWWEHIKGCSRFGEYDRPWLGMQVRALFAADMDERRIFKRTFPNIFNGIIVEKVTPGSPAAAAGLCPKDVIVQFDGEDVQTCLELFKITWNKVGKQVGMSVLRSRTGERKDLTMVIGCVDKSQFNCWPLPKEYWKAP